MKIKAISEQNIARLEKFDKWIRQSTNLSESARKAYVNNMKLFFKEFNVFSKEAFRTWTDDLTLYGMSVQTCNVKINSFNKFCIFMKKPDLKLKPARVEKRLFLENVPTEEQYAKLLNYLRTHKNRDYYYWIRVLSCTGARVSEFLLMTWEGIAGGNFMLRGKGNKYRNFFIPRDLSEEIKSYANREGKSGQFARNRYGKPLSARGLNVLLKEFGEKCSLPKDIMHAHAFRHFFAKQYLKNSKNDVVQLATYMGHESLDTTRLYLLKSKEEQMRDYNRHVNW